MARESDPLDCARCPFETGDRRCRIEDGSGLPNCPTEEGSELLEGARAALREPGEREFARQASIQEGEGYANRDLGYDRVKPVKPRIVEIVEFAERMGYERLGLAFCTGLRKEAEIVAGLLEARGFRVSSVICKAGRVPKEEIGVRDEEKIAPGTDESMCNPVYQARLLDEEGTQLNVVLGLCVGHDSLFFRHSQAPCTVLAVKDRVLGHNPLAAVYNLDSYYRYLK
jgi:uncharacterized metal-binding protein